MLKSSVMSCGIKRPQWVNKLEQKNIKLSSDNGLLLDYMKPLHKIDELKSDLESPLSGPYVWSRAWNGRPWPGRSQNWMLMYFIINLSGSQQFSGSSIKNQVELSEWATGRFMHWWSKVKVTLWDQQPIDFLPDVHPASVFITYDSKS